MDYATRITVVQNGDGAGVELNGGNPVIVHSVHVATATGAVAAVITFSQTTTAGGAITTEVGAMSSSGTGDADDWAPRAFFDRGFRVVQEPVSGSFVTIAWRPTG